MYNFDQMFVFKFYLSCEIILPLEKRKLNTLIKSPELLYGIYAHDECMLNSD